jgi:secreted Zn-dependent insulinase-like peptidase
MNNEHELYPLICIESLPPQMPGAAGNTEPWFDMEYVSAPLPAELLERWRATPASPDLSLPLRNGYVASDFDLVAAEEAPAANGAAANGTVGVFWGLPQAAHGGHLPTVAHHITLGPTWHAG